MTHMIDTHAHLSYDQLTDLSSILSNAKKEKISHIINICTDEPSLLTGILLKEKNDWIYNAAAVAPHDVEKEGGFWPIVEKYARNKMLIAIGETGLDYYYHKESKNLQIEFFQKHLQLASSLKLPFLIHCREAFNDLFSLTREPLSIPVILHCFTGSLAEAKEVLNKGWAISFSGIITFKNNQLLQEVVKYVPLEQMVIETDSPYLAPQKFRGQKNEPAFLIEIARQIALIKNIKIEEVIEITTSNAKEIFQIR